MLESIVAQSGEKSRKGKAEGFPQREAGAVARAFQSPGRGRCGKTRSRISEYAIEAEKCFRLYGLEVLRANDDEIGGLDCVQHGWESLYYPVGKLHLERRYPAIQAIRGAHSSNYRDWLYEHNIVDEKDIYAWFYDLVWRQNNQSVIVQGPSGKMAIPDYSGRWNYRRPFGYQVRKRLKSVLEVVERPVLLTCTVSDKCVVPLMGVNTNHTAVSFAITQIGGWARSFNQRLYRYQERRGIPWGFKGWVVEFQKGNNRGMPHLHMIYEGAWLGKIGEIEELWRMGGVDIETKKDIQKRYPGRGGDGLRVANYLTKYVTKMGGAITDDGIHKGYAWLAYSQGRVFSVQHQKKGAIGE